MVEPKVLHSIVAKFKDTKSSLFKKFELFRFEIDESGSALEMKTPKEKKLLCKFKLKDMVFAHEKKSKNPMLRIDAVALYPEALDIININPNTNFSPTIWEDERRLINERRKFHFVVETPTILQNWKVILVRHGASDRTEGASDKPNLFCSIQSENSSDIMIPKKEIEILAVEQWRPDHVLEWLKRIRVAIRETGKGDKTMFDRYANIFKENDINGRSLVEMDYKDMTQMGINSQQDRMKLYEKIQRLIDVKYFDCAEDYILCKLELHFPELLNMMKEADVLRLVKRDEMRKVFLQLGSSLQITVAVCEYDCSSKIINLKSDAVPFQELNEHVSAFTGTDAKFDQFKTDQNSLCIIVNDILLTFNAAHLCIPKVLDKSAQKYLEFVNKTTPSVFVTKISQRSKNLDEVEKILDVILDWNANKIYRKTANFSNESNSYLFCRRLFSVLSYKGDEYLFDMFHAFAEFKTQDRIPKNKYVPSDKLKQLLPDLRSAYQFKTLEKFLELIQDSIVKPLDDNFGKVLKKDFPSDYLLLCNVYFDLSGGQTVIPFDTKE